ncbi:PREDICTED: uncharacterized protein LOC109344960 isoform X1 [Lupinus angustifolius]|uniref:uncharacterized protein LOC109344960 isoform X1 n=1 Tax=Lupinus angustifolius TaxID=3871 RepID=UPI00092E7B07|nr:PREDICTED: uncharacterized protein LOC109344960 isoform X1 [Lupinus angustifolius]
MMFSFCSNSSLHHSPISSPNTNTPFLTTLNFTTPCFKNRTLALNNRFRIITKSQNSETTTQQQQQQKNEQNSTSLLSFLCPLLKLFSGGDPSGQRNFTLEVATSSMASLSRFAWGSNSKVETSNLPITLQLFEFEACPFCRRVREALTELDLSVEVYPCPKGSVRHREVVRKSGGKEMFPFLIDRNSGISMYESGDIVKYLFEQYGEGRSPSPGLLESTIFTGWMPTILRAGRGMTLWERSTPDPPPGKLELFSYENNPYARIVREALCELELPYILQNVGEGSCRMKSLVDASGSKEVPYLIDHSTGFQSGEYKKILHYLFETYSAAIV